MCDCYLHQCKLCPTQVGIHLGDWATGRNEIEVLCSHHYKKVRKQSKPYTIFKCANGQRIAIIYLTKNAKLRRKENVPNMTCRCEPEEMTQ
jgi:hypothetical protein